MMEGKLLPREFLEWKFCCQFTGNPQKSLFDTDYIDQYKDTWYYFLCRPILIVSTLVLSKNKLFHVHQVSSLLSSKDLVFLIKNINSKEKYSQPQVLEKILYIFLQI